METNVCLISCINLDYYQKLLLYNRKGVVDALFSSAIDRLDIDAIVKVHVDEETVNVFQMSINLSRMLPSSLRLTMASITA